MRRGQDRIRASSEERPGVLLNSLPGTGQHFSPLPPQRISRAHGVTRLKSPVLEHEVTESDFRVNTITLAVLVRLLKVEGQKPRLCYPGEK